MSKGGKYALGGSKQELKKVDADHYGLEKAQKQADKKAAANKAVKKEAPKKAA